MSNKTFVDKVKSYFGYLESEYDYKVALASNAEARPETDGIVKYLSRTTLVIIDSETGYVAVRFLRAQDEERYYLDPVSIHEYLNTNDQEKRILLSKDKNEKDTAQLIFNKTFLLSSTKWKTSQDSIDSNLDRQMMNYAKWLRENAQFCLMGDFSRWPAFYEYKINRLIADEIRRGGKDIVKAIIKDENGVIKMIERPIFQIEQDYLAKLRKDIERG